MRYPILPAGAFTAAFLVLVPAFWHWRAGNVPTLSLIAWLFTLNLIYGANSLVWSDNIWDKAPVWCDVCEYLFLKLYACSQTPLAFAAAKLIIGASTALPACTLCICKYLAMIGGNRTVGLNRKDRRRITMLDFALCWGVPVIFMALRKSSNHSSRDLNKGLIHLIDYIVQEHRYNIVQYVGCQPVTYVSIPGILIVWVPPLLLSVGTLAYAGAKIWPYLQHPELTLSRDRAISLRSNARRLLKRSPSFRLSNVDQPIHSTRRDVINARPLGYYFDVAHDLGEYNSWSPTLGQLGQRPFGLEPRRRLYLALDEPRVA